MRFPLFALLLFLCTSVRAQKMATAPPGSMGFDTERLEGTNTLMQGFVDPEEELVMLVYTNVHPIPQYGEVVRKFRVAVYAALME
jgi:hypothetical protein